MVWGMIIFGLALCICAFFALRDLATCDADGDATGIIVGTIGVGFIGALLVVIGAGIAIGRAVLA